MAAGAVRFATVEARPTAVVAQTTTWQEFPKLWGSLLGQVYEFVRPHPELATGDDEKLWQNVMLYKDQRPDVEVGVLVSGPFQADRAVTLSALPAGEVATAPCRTGLPLYGGGGAPGAGAGATAAAAAGAGAVLFELRS